MNDQQQYVSLNPDDAVSGGFLSDRDATIRKARFEETTYGGRSNPSMALIIGYELDGDEELREQIYSVGPVEKYTTSEDGSRLVPQGGQKGISKQCNAYQFIVSLINNGWPKSGDRAIGADISVIEGANVHLDEITIQREFKDDPTKKAKPIAVVTKINTFPWDAPAATAPGGPGKAKAAKTGSQKSSAGSKAPGGATAAASAANPEVEQLAQRIVLEAGVAAGGTVPKATVIQSAFKYKFENAALKPGVLAKVGSDPFLNAGQEAGLWAYDGKQILVDVESAPALLDAMNG